MHEKKFKLGLTKEPVDPPIDLKKLYDKVKKKKEQEKK